MATHDEILNVLQVLAAAYGKDQPGKELTEAQIQVYLHTLDALDAGRLEQAAYWLIKSGQKFFPRVVELREAARRIKYADRPGDDLRAYWIGMEALRQSFCALVPDDDRRFTRYFQPAWRDGLAEEAQAWWDGLPAPAASDVELEKRYPLPEGVLDG
jgi:hypothetical protein